MVSQKSKFLKKAMEIVFRNHGVFKALEDFERTGKITVKTRLNFTIDKEIAKKFREYGKKNKINMSEAIECLIRENILSESFGNKRR